MSTLGIYIHIPFCKQKCNYCSFVSSFNTEQEQRIYVDAVKKQIIDFGKKYPDKLVDTIYIGGGTPSALYDGGISSIVESIRANFNTNIIEFTVEANPESVISRLQEFKACGVTRISMGVQSLDNEVLQGVGRLHDSKTAQKAIEKTLSVFSNVNVDIMLGLPFDNLNKLKNTIDTILTYPITHLSAYALKVEEGTSLYSMVSNKQIILPDEDATVDMYELVQGMAKVKGFNRYEISNFAKDNYECKHNLKYWLRDEYIGVGVAAHSFINECRYFMMDNIEEYIKDPLAIKGSMVEPRDRAFEYIMLGLRLRDGFLISDISKQGEDFFIKYSKALNKTSKYLIINKDRIRVKEKYLYCLNSILLEFMDN